MSSDEVKVKFVADTTGLQGVNVPNTIPAAGGGSSGNNAGTTPPAGGGGAGGGSGGAGNGKQGGSPNQPNRGRSAFPWEKGWGAEFQQDLAGQAAGMFSGINLLNTAINLGVEGLKHGIDRARLEGVGYGSSKPIASNDDEFEGRELNRRTEFEIIK